MRFRFRLEPLLAERARVERERRNEVAASLRELERAMSDLVHLREELAGCMHPDELRLCAPRSEYLGRAILAQESVVRACRQREETARLRLREAAIGKMALEKLKARRYRAHLVLLDRAEEADTGTSV